MKSGQSDRKRIIGKPQLTNNRDLHPPAATRIGSPLFSVAASTCALYITKYFIIRNFSESRDGNGWRYFHIMELDFYYIVFSP